MTTTRRACHISAALTLLLVAILAGSPVAPARADDAWTGKCAPEQDYDAQGRYRIFYDRMDAYEYADTTEYENAKMTQLVTWLCVDRNVRTQRLRVALQIHSRAHARGFTDEGPGITDCALVYSIKITHPESKPQGFSQMLKCNRDRSEKLLVSFTDQVFTRVPMGATVVVKYQPAVQLYWNDLSRPWRTWKPITRTLPVEGATCPTTGCRR